MIAGPQFFRKLLLVYACFLLCTGIAWGQAMNSADVTGTVTDQSGAVIPGVTVTINNLDKNTERTIVTNDAGIYDTGPLVPGDQYQLTFQKEGFTTLRRGPMTLRVGVTGLNVQLNVSQTAEAIVVSEAAPVLETTSPEISATLAVETLAQLPQVGTPDWQQFIVLLPGTAGTPQNGNNTTNPGMDGVAANGSMPYSTALFDGVNANSPMSNNVIATPIFDAIGEVKISASLFSAQYGTGGVLYNQISKGGTNEFHGMAYDYVRNTAFNASDFQFGLDRPKTPINYHALGGNIGGPMIKDRVFFFFAVERIINHGGSRTSFLTVPTTRMLTGDFSGMNTIYDPRSQVVDPSTGVVTRQPFADNKIPELMLDPVAKAIQAIYPAPNTPGTVVNGVTTNNYVYSVPSINPQIKYFGRFDADVTPNNRITGSTAWNDSWGKGTGPVCPINCLDRNIFNNNSQISDYWSISPHTLNEFRFGFMAEYDTLKPQTLGQGWPDKLGLKFAKADVFPSINISGIYGLGPSLNANYNENQFDISDVVTLIRGRHSLKLGANVILMRANSTAWGNINGATLDFTGVYTAGSNSGPLASSSGASYADFLLGYARSWSASVTPQYGGRLRSPAAFIQDDFKVSPNLTLNLGLRWLGTTGWSDVNGNARSFDPTIINPATNQPGAMWYAVTAVNGRTALQKSRFNNWLPRIGFAYLLGDRTTVRGGFGMYTFPWNVDGYASNSLGRAFGASGNLTDSTNNVQPVVILSSTGDINYQGEKGASINSLFKDAPLEPDAYNGQGVGFVQYDSPVPLLKSWNLTIQRQIGQTMVAEIAYVGSRGTNLAFVTDLNQVPEDKMGPNSAQFRPYPFQSITGVNTEGISNYHALQLQLSKRMSSGLSFNVNYTWSHMLSNQDSSGRGTKMGNTPYQSAYDPSRNYGSSNFDIRHMFKGYAIYDLPFGRGRRFLNTNRALDAVLGGWTLSSTVVAQGGNPFTPYMLVNNSFSLSSNNVQYPDVIGNPVRKNPTIDSWFNVDAFAAPAPGKFGNMGRNSIYGPGLFTVGLSLVKTFAITERIRFDLSGNATNALNHPSFAQPDLAIGPGHVGKITAVTVGGRQIELVGKLRF
ncbi:MAG: carboxypeptidase regulatory-like domain-containing protein [bacterium]